MTLKVKIIICTLSILTAFAFGRYSATSKVINDTKTQETDKKVSDTDTDRNRHKETTTVDVQAPDGTHTITTQVVDDTTTDRKTHSTDEDSKTTQSHSETTYGDNKVTISALGGINFPTPVYGISATKPVFGPVALGAWALSAKTVGISIGLVF